MTDKTLKQLFEEILENFSGCHFEEAPLYWEDSFREAVRVWLLLKQQENLNNPILLYETLVIRDRLFNELLEDLQK